VLERIITLLEILALVIPGIILALLLSSWAHFADDRPPLRVALYVVFGLGAMALAAFGALIVLMSDQLIAEFEDDLFAFRTGAFLLATGLVSGLLLLPPVRSVLARIIPIKANSIPDMVGLIIMVSVSIMMIWTIDLTFAENNGETDLSPVDGISLVFQALLLVAIAYFAIGGAINRDFSSVQHRLGLFMPTARQVAISFMLIIPLFIVSAIGGLLTDMFQPGFTDEIDDIMGEVTGDLISVQGALLIGLTAGIGEEILFRGAIQPKYGIAFTSIIFTLIHVQYGFSFVLLGVFLTSIIFGIQRIKMNTTCCIITHAAYNFSVVMLSTLAV
jgi:uncharacterized protein